MDSQQSHILPGPIDTSVLYLQPKHRSQAVWFDVDGAATTTIDCRRGTTTRCANLETMHPGVVQLLRHTGFYGVARIGFRQVNHHLITALVERWRPEMHTFHLPEGECTFTLQDIAIQTGLPVDGQPLIGRDAAPSRSMCLELLGVAPPPTAMKGSLVKTSWLRDAIPIPQAGEDAASVVFYVRAYIMRLLGGIVFPLKDTSRVSLHYLPYLSDLDAISTYSWGSTFLAHLYRELCIACRYPLAVQMGGPTFLLQVWVWDRFSSLSHLVDDIGVPYDAPPAARWCQPQNHTQIVTHTLQAIREQLDRTRQDNIVWVPYDNYILQNLPPYCLVGRHIWSAVVPLISICLVEWHPADRVMRQFGYQQPIPTPPPVIEHLHSVDFRQRIDDWSEFHARWYALWQSREQWVQRGETGGSTIHYHSKYMEWYRSITRRWIGSPGASIGALADAMEHLATATELREARRIALMSQRATGEQQRMEDNPPPEPSYQRQYLDAPATPPRRRRERRHLPEIPNPNQSQYGTVPPPLSLHNFAESSPRCEAGPSGTSLFQDCYDPNPAGNCDAGPSQPESQNWGSFTHLGSASGGDAFHSLDMFTFFDTPVATPVATPNDDLHFSLRPPGSRDIPMDTDRRMQRHLAYIRTNVPRNRRYDDTPPN